MGSVAEVRWAELVNAPGTARRLLTEHLVVRAWGAADVGAAAGWSAAVYAARDRWNADFGGEQYSLGRAWYAHLEEERERDYFAAASSSNAEVERALPGAVPWMIDAVARATGEPARVRAGWCGPGVHVFPAGGQVALHGGVVHFDTEGLSAADRAARVPALTLVLMLQPAIDGGGLSVWDVVYDGEDHVDEAEIAASTSVSVAYRAGDLVLLDGYRLHQIQPFGGTRDRISLTAHAARGRRGWDVWFLLLAATRWASPRSAFSFVRG